MKNTILFLAVPVFMAGTMLTGCHSSVKKADNSQDKELKNDLNKTKEDLKIDYQAFKIESEDQISMYEKNIAELKEKAATVKKEDKAVYEKKLADLEQKNADLKKKLENYKDEGQDKWISFKSEFNRDLDTLGKALKNFTVNKKK